MGLNMGNRLYDLMDWPSIEGVVYSECDEPMELLGGRICKDGFLIQTFAPDAVEMNVRVDGRKKLYPMEKMDEAGFFAVLLPGRKKISYTFVKEDIYGKKMSFVEAFKYYKYGYNYLMNLKKNSSLPNVEIYKLFIKMDYQILNQYHLNVSGGERAEFNL